MTRARDMLVALAMAGTCLVAGAQSSGVPPSPDASCTVTAVNRTAPLLPDHTFSIFNVPGVAGSVSGTTRPGPPFRVRAVCSDGTLGETDLVQPQLMEMVLFSGPIHWRPLTAVPVAIQVVAAQSRLRAGDSTTLRSTAVLEGGTTLDVTPRSKGTHYSSSNPLIAQVSEDGVIQVLANVAPGSTARVIVGVQNDGVAASTVLQIGPRGRVQGRVLRADGVTPVSGAQVSVLRAQPRETTATVTTDASGRFSVEDVSAGAYEFTVNDPATGDQGKGSTQLSEEGQTASTDIRLNGQGTVTVRLLAGAGTPLAGSPVTFTSLSSFRDVRTLLTDPQGQAVFDRAPAGLFSVSARDELSAQISAAGGTLPVGGTPVVTLQLQPTGTIAGIVRNSQGAAVQGDVQVRLLSSRRGIVTQMMAGADAGFRFDGLPLADGPYALDAMQDGRLKARVSGLVLTQGGQTLQQDLVYGPVGLVKGAVTHAGGAPAADALVTLQSRVGLRFSFTTRTDGLGQYAFDGVPVGAFSLVATAVNEETGTVDGELTAEGQTVTLDVPLASAGIVGTVYERDGITPVGAGVTVQTPGAATTTDANGRYALNVSRPGLYRIEAIGQGGHRGRTEIVVTTIVAGQPRVADIVFIGRGRVSGVVTSATGLPLAGVPVKYMGSGLFSDSATTSTDDSGRYVFDDMFVGEFSVLATQADTRRAGLARGRLSHNGESVTADIVLTATGSVRGRVLAVDGVTPVSGAEVSLSLNQGGLSTTFADQNGAYVFPLVPVGEVIVSARNLVDGDRGRSATRLSTMDEQRVVDVRLVGIGQVRVRVVDPQGAPMANIKTQLFSASPFGSNLESTTSEGGLAAFPGVFTGDFSVSATVGKGVNALNGHVTGVMRPGETIELTLRMERRPVGIVEGVARSSSGTPLPGLTITLRNPLDRTMLNTSSDAQGRFRLETVEAGPAHELSAWIDGRVRSRLTVQLVEDGEVRQVDLIMLGVGTVSGVTRDAQGAPLAGAVVTARHPDPVYGGQWTVTSQADGRFSLTDIPAGRSTLRAQSADGRLDGQDSVEVRFDGDAAVRDLILVDSAVTLPLVLADANGTTFKLTGDGSADDGLNRVFRGDGQQNTRAARLELLVGDVPVPFLNGDGTLGSLTRDGQLLEVDDTHPASGLYVARRVYVPKHGYFARYLEVLENRTDAPITVGVRITSHFAGGSGGSRIVDTSSGDAALDLGGASRDRWTVIDDERDGDPFSTDGSQLPSTAVIFDGVGATLQAASAEASPIGASQRLRVEWRQVTVPAHGTVSVMHFLSQQLGRAPARLAAERLSQLPPEALEGLSEQDRQSIVNFVLPADGQGALAPLPAMDGTVKGRVLGGDSATPLPKARVAVRGEHPLFGRTFSVVADDDGRFELAAKDLGREGVIGVARDRFTLLTTHEPTEQRATATGVFAAGAKVQEQDLVFLDSGVLRGRVLRHNGGTAAEGKVVVPVRRGEGQPFDLDTDILPDGTYVFPVLPPRDYPVTATLPHLQGEPLTGTSSGLATVAARQAMVMDVTLQATGEVSGRVNGPDGQPAVNAEVFLGRVPGGQLYRRTTSDSGGNFRLPDVAEGRYEIGALNGAQQGERQPVQVTRDATTQVTLTMTRMVQLTLQVRHARGAPAPEAKVLLRGIPYDLNGAGEVTLEVPALSQLEFLATHPGNTSLTTPQVVVLDGLSPTAHQVIVLPAAGTIVGEVRRPDGLVPAPGVAMFFRDATGALRGSATTDALGLYRSPAVPVGAYVVSAEDAAAFKFADGDTTLASDGDEQTVNLTLSENRIALPASLRDANGFLYDVGLRGQLMKGLRDDIDPYRFTQFVGVGGVSLELNGQAFAGDMSARLEAGRRQFAITQPEPLAGLQVTRKVYVPRGGYFARYLEVLENRGASPVTVDVRLKSQHARREGDFALRVQATSSGDEQIQTDGEGRDRWVVLAPSLLRDPMTANNFPASEAFVLSGATGSLAHDRMSNDGGTSVFEAGWSSVTVPPGERRVLMHFAVQQVNLAGARASAQRLVQLPPEALEALTERERADIVNFAVPADGSSAVEPLPSLLGTVAGRVFEGDGVTPVPAASVQVRSSHPLFNRTWVSRGSFCDGDGSRGLLATADGAFRLSGRLQDQGSVVVPVGFDLTVSSDRTSCNVPGHPVTGVQSSDVTLRFVASSVAIGDVVFDTGIVAGSVASPSDYGVTGGEVVVQVAGQRAVVPVASGGDFVFPGLPAGAHDLAVQVPHAQGSGLKGGREGVVVVRGQTVVATLPLQPTGAVHGLVTTMAGQPLQDLEVTLEATDNSLLRKTPTDGAGRFQLSAVPVGTHTVWVRAPDTGALTQESVTVQAGQTTERVLQLQANGFVRVQAGLPRGTPAVDAPVRLTSPASGAVDQLVGLTDAQGRMTVVVPAGAFTITVDHPSDQGTPYIGRRSFSGTIAAGETLDRALTLAPRARLVVTVVDADAGGVPVAGARVALTEPSCGSCRTQMTDAQGRTVFANVWDGPFSVTIAAPGGASTRLDGTVDDSSDGQDLVRTASVSSQRTVYGVNSFGLERRPYAVAVQPGDVLSVSVAGTPTQGGPEAYLTRVQVYDTARAQVARGYGFGSTNGYQQANELGDLAAIPIASAGEQILIVSPYFDDPRDLGAYRLQVKLNGSAVEPHAPTDSGTVKGRILRADGVTPMVSQWVELRGIDALGARLRARTDADGRYAIGGMPAGAVWLSLLSDDGRDVLLQRELTVAAGQDTVLDHVLPAQTRLTVRVQVEGGASVPGSVTVKVSDLLGARAPATLLIPSGQTLSQAWTATVYGDAVVASTYHPANGAVFATHSMTAADGESREVTLTLSAATLSGRTFDGAGQPLVGAVVSARGESGGLLGAEVSDSTGRYLFAALPVNRPLTVSMSAPGGAPGESVPLTLTVGQQAQQDLRMGATGSVAGTVRNTAGEVLPFANVSLSMPGDAGVEERFTSADDQGGYRFDNLPTGRLLTLTASFDSPFQTVSQQATLTLTQAGEAARQDFALDLLGGTLRVKVQGAGGVTPSDDFCQRITATTPGGSASRYYVSCVQEWVVFEHVPAGPVTIDGISGYQTPFGPVTVQVVSAQTTDALATISIVRGSVTRADGQPAPYASVSVSTEQGGLYGNANELGQFALSGVPVGQHRLRAQDQESGLFAETTFELLDAAVPVQVNVRMPASGRVEGTLRDAGGLPVPEAMVYVRSSGLDLDHQVVTDASGNWSLPHVALGAVSATGVHPTGLLVAVGEGTLGVPGQTLRIELGFPPAGVVEGTVREPGGAVVTGAEVQLRLKSPGTAYADGYRVVTTDAGGRYRFADVTPGAVQLQAYVSANWERLGLAQGVAVAQESVTVDITMGTGVRLGTRLTDAETGLLIGVDGNGALSPFDPESWEYAFDGGGLALEVAGLPFPHQGAAAVDASGRELSLGPVRLGGLEVSRRVHVPLAGGFARVLETFTNPGNQPIVVPVSLRTRLGGGAPVLVEGPESNGRRFAAVRQDEGWPTAASAGWTLAGTGAVAIPSTLDFSPGVARWGWQITVPPGETVRLLSYLVVQPGARTATALSRARALSEGGVAGQYLGLDAPVPSQTKNFLLP